MAIHVLTKEGVDIINANTRARKLEPRNNPTEGFDKPRILGQNGGTGFHAKATSPLTKGPQPPGTTVAEYKGPAWNGGLGEDTGKTPEIHHLGIRNLVAGEWMFCQKIKGKIYCGPIECPPPSESEP